MKLAVPPCPNAVFAGDSAAAQGNRPADQVIHAQAFQRQAGPDDIGDAVDGPDLVKVNLVDGGAMDLGLGLRQPLEDLGGMGSRPRGQVPAGDNVQHVGQAPVRMIVTLMAAGVVDHEEPQGGDALADDGLGRDAQARQRQAAQRRRDRPGLGARVDQRRDDHVAAGPGKAVKIRRLHRSRFLSNSPV